MRGKLSVKHEAASGQVEALPLPKTLGWERVRCELTGQARSGRFSWFSFLALLVRTPRFFRLSSLPSAFDRPTWRRLFLSVFRHFNAPTSRLTFSIPSPGESQASMLYLRPSVTPAVWVTVPPNPQPGNATPEDPTIYCRETLSRGRAPTNTRSQRSRHTRLTRKRADHRPPTIRAPHSFYSPALPAMHRPRRRVLQHGGRALAATRAGPA